MKTNHREERQEKVYITKEQLTPSRLMLKAGDVIYIYKSAPIGERVKGFERRVPVQIVKLYRNHALCAVNGRREAFTYAEIAQAQLRERKGKK